MKAHNRLQNELDIKQFIRNIRTLRNSLKFLTTRRERNLVKMQADKNVIILKESDKAQLCLPRREPAFISYTGTRLTSRATSTKATSKSLRPKSRSRKWR